MDRRPGRLGASRGRSAYSAGAARHTWTNGDAQHLGRSHHLGTADHCTGGSHNDDSTDDHDDSTGDHDDEARCHLRRVLEPLGGARSSRIPP